MHIIGLVLLSFLTVYLKSYLLTRFLPTIFRILNFTLHQKHLEGSLKDQLLGPRFFYSMGLRSRMKIYISSRFDPVGLGTTGQESLL